MWLSRSKLKTLDWLSKSIKNLPKLTLFNASNNQITKLPSLKGSSLNSIYLKENPI